MFVNIVLILVLLYTIILFLVILSAFLTFLRTRVPFVPTPLKDLNRLIQELNIGPTDVFLDIGSGNGRVVFEMEKYGFSEVRGIESGMWTHLVTLMRKKMKKSKAVFKRKNFFNESWADVTVLYCYLYPPLMPQVGEKAGGEMKPGTRVVSRDFPISNLKLVKQFYTDRKHEFFIYEI